MLLEIKTLTHESNTMQEVGTSSALLHTARCSLRHLISYQLYRRYGASLVNKIKLNQINRHWR